MFRQGASVTQARILTGFPFQPDEVGHQRGDNHNRGAAGFKGLRQLRRNASRAPSRVSASTSASPIPPKIRSTPAKPVHCR